MRYDVTTELKSLVNPFSLAQWQQLYDTLYTKDAKEDLLYDIAEIIDSYQDILRIMDGTAD